MPTETPYPVPGRKPFVECPVHLLVVPVDERGRLAGSCPGCRREAGEAVETLSRIRDREAVLLSRLPRPEPTVGRC